jgi:hypothetical protein
MRNLSVVLAAGLVMGAILPAGASEPWPSSKPVQSQDRWSMEPIEAQDARTASHTGLCTFDLTYDGGPPSGTIEWVILPWESHQRFSDEIVAEGSISLDAMGDGTTGPITLPNDHYYDLLWTEDGGLTADWVPLLLDGCEVFFEAPPSDGFGIVDAQTGQWYLRDPANGATTSFFYGDPGDLPMVGDWDCDGDETPGLYRQSDGFVYLRNSNSQGVADVRFFFGNPGDIPLAGDFNNDGCDSVSIYRPAEGTIHIIDQLGANEGGLGPADLSYAFGNPGDKPFVGDFDGDGIDTIGLHRETTGLVYFRQTHTQGNADHQFIFGDPGDKIMAADWTAGGIDTVGLFRPSNSTVYLRYSNSQGDADFAQAYGIPSGLPVAGWFGMLAGG